MRPPITIGVPVFVVLLTIGVFTGSVAISLLGCVTLAVSHD